jgi:hypothetical protein
VSFEKVRLPLLNSAEKSFLQEEKNKNISAIKKVIK